MGYTAKAPANYFLVRYGKYQISPLRLQKLVYISHGWHMALRAGAELVDDEYAEAWEFGPAFPSLYHEFRDFGGKPITRKAQELVFDNAGTSFVIPEIHDNDERTVVLLDRVWAVYERFTPSQLSALTHAHGTPWSKTRQEFPGIRNASIPNKWIREHYAEKRREPRS